MADRNTAGKPTGTRKTAARTSPAKPTPAGKAKPTPAGKAKPTPAGKAKPTPAGKATKVSPKKQTAAIRKATKELVADVGTPEKERLAPSTNGKVGSPARDEAVAPAWAQRGSALTTSTGVGVDDTDNSLKVGARGPALLADFHLREKVMHFDHERIPERVVHARGAGAHGHFRVTDPIDDLTCARVLTDASLETPVFVRFSTVAGSRGSMDTARDVRGFATKFYTEEGIWDLVGNNIPVFFIQDGIKFPDIIHAAKPEPDREIPQAATAHDTFWDFAANASETTHMLMWTMSDRAIPRSFRTMEGFGVHTFRLYDEAGNTSLVKFHWKPVGGVHSLVWEEAQMLGGIDGDFHRRDLWDAIESGSGPEYDLGVQVFPDVEDQMFEGIDLLDSTKLVPEELAPVRVVGRLTLDRNPTNFFAETEQVAFCTAHVPRGIDFTDDPLLQARNFSYLDTQLTRLGGPNFDQLPINRPRSPVNTNQRDGFGQQAIHEGVVTYTPTAIADTNGSVGCPFHVGAAGQVHVPRPVEGRIVRERPQSFDDHFSQATMFWNSMSEVERDHIVGAFSFELGKCVRRDVRERMLVNLANVDGELCERVATHLGLEAPAGTVAADAGRSPALSQVQPLDWPIDGRVVGVLVDDGVDAAAVDQLRTELGKRSATLYVIAGHRGTIVGKDGSLAVDRAVMTTRSVEYDALVIAGGSGRAVAADPNTAVALGEAYRHHKTIGAWGDGVDALDAARLDVSAPGVVIAAEGGRGFGRAICDALARHRHWERQPTPVPLALDA
ncbi:MAG TPA: catalase [Microthrixaceae bacterium]|nr:catalase [Microthrixaceae bacterium]